MGGGFFTETNGNGGGEPPRLRGELPSSLTASPHRSAGQVHLRQGDGGHNAGRARLGIRSWEPNTEFQAPEAGALCVFRHSRGRLKHGLGIAVFLREEFRAGFLKFLGELGRRFGMGGAAGSRRLAENTGIMNRSRHGRSPICRPGGRRCSPIPACGRHHGPKPSA